MNIHKTYIVKQEEDFDEIAKFLVKIDGKPSVWLFIGELGAGKTTFIKYLAKNLQVIDNVTSPTFSLINEYLTVDNKKIYHFDFYRINNEIEAAEIGLDDYFYSGNICFIEWFERVSSTVSHDQSIFITINIIENNWREVIVSINF
ncbi:MAG: tRNA (adenosine(37)-N6)-threonylcarbamoyltransferase complex ATPase subunit type 1 TsaE [Chitinophagaceae bacterium]|nr:tRNA (adenosine(37)-N6)-threonylcarbamoyltransferase complex ATPase subunit type 1 TsaE [Chitinophagaceae bacterium]